MAFGRVHWEELPEATRRAVERHTGPVVAARTVTQGRNCTVAAVLDTRRGEVFVKGVHRSHPRIWTQDMEESVNSHVLSIAPRLLWRVRGEWDVLGFECFDGSQADYSPASADIAKVIRTFQELGGIRCPNVSLKKPEHRWRSYVDDEADLAWFQGDHLLHIDPTPPNLLMVDERAVLLDWAWPTKGAGWIDAACLVIRLIEAGHSAEQAEALVSEIPVWATASREGLLVFARANDRMWSEVADGRPLGIAKAARTWLEHRVAT
ncbi:aminoglycoside phosphotransferase [Thermomonospora umbrina]|uniref:Phosphotransferase family enzyme n=1 Tax=Thermomonospora umbrina TaxID=111806 RepID=A0A3D9STG1_9ACTN|nr:aminoglycoside phosphotransferase [Thermomonospora umbrina]REE97770.1 hypothetical protein DFJ69_3245 [Thermomonospora umbrina]